MTPLSFSFMLPAQMGDDQSPMISALDLASLTGAPAVSSLFTGRLSWGGVIPSHLSTDTHGAARFHVMARPVPPARAYRRAPGPREPTIGTGLSNGARHASVYHGEHREPRMATEGKETWRRALCRIERPRKCPNPRCSVALRGSPCPTMKITLGGGRAR